MHELVRTFEHLSEPKPDFLKEEKEEQEEYCPNCGRMYPNPANPSLARNASFLASTLS